jgi:protein MpaA
MKIIKIITIICTIAIIVSPADSFSLKEKNAILNKAIKLYNGLNRSNIKWDTIGRSNLNNRIYYKQFGSGDKLTLIIGGMHGDEPAGFISALKLAQFLKRNPSTMHNRVIIVPCINPDGLSKGTRVNARGVDINRNFPGSTWSSDFIKSYNNPGSHPASEPETAALMKLIEKYKPNMIIQMHQPFNAIYPSPNTPAELMDKMSDLSGLPVIDDIGYPTPGSLGNYRVAQDYDIIGITFELCDIDMEPEYHKITAALFTAVNY